jgi:hypothetical protein
VTSAEGFGKTAPVRGKRRKKKGRDQLQSDAVAPGPAPLAPAPTGPVVLNLRAFLGHHELPLLRCEGHLHYVGGISAGMLRDSRLRFDGPASSGLRAARPLHAAERTAPRGPGHARGGR